jgi:hypothetical protein
MSVNEGAERGSRRSGLARNLLFRFAKSMLGLSAGVETLLLGLVVFLRELGENVSAEGGARRPDLEKRFGEGTRDIVEEASWESFPASDAPPY